MKVVLLHDWLTGLRGGERVLEVFCEMFPDAPLYTLIYQKGSTSKVIEDRKIVSSFLNKLPGIKSGYRKFLPIFPLAADSLKIIENADLVLSSSHCVIKGVKKPPNARHISYIHSPMRYIYDQFDTYFGDSTSLPIRVGGHLFRDYLQTWDLMSNDNVDLMVANSKFVQERINQFYQAPADIVHPFVDLKDFRAVYNSEVKKGDFYLMVTAFAPNKRVDLAIQAFNQLERPLKIIGGGQEEKKLKKLAGPTIEFLGNLSREEVIDNMSRAKGFIFPGIEDFGITPLESLAAGTPVVAFKYGGVLETLNESVAIFFEEATVQALIDAVNKLSEQHFRKETMWNRANDFSREKFKNNILATINKVMNK